MTLVNSLCAEISIYQGVGESVAGCLAEYLGHQAGPDGLIQR